MAYRRKQYEIIASRIKEPRNKIQVLLGPRQVGKSTLISQVLKDSSIPYTMVKADNVISTDTGWINYIWRSVRGTMVSKHDKEHLLVIDEIQKIANWSEAVKEEWDSDSENQINLKVVLLGSSRLMLQFGLKESLAGRFELIRMGHWTYSEMQQAFGLTLDEYIYFGGYPGSASFIKDEARWKRYIKDSIVSPAIEKDVVMTSRIYKPVLMKRLMQLGCAYSTKELSLTKVLGKLQDVGNVTTLAGYLDLLRQCQMLCGLQKYAIDDARKYNSVPKFEVFNNALLTAFHRERFETVRSDAELWGRWVESAVGAHILSFSEEEDYQVFYWRDRNNEVDFIIVSDYGCVALEVKSGRRSAGRGMTVFNAKFHPTQTYIIGTGGISIEEFLQMEVPKLLW